MPKRLGGNHAISELNPLIKIKNENVIAMTHS